MSQAAGLLAAWSWQYGMVELMRGPPATTLGNTDISWLSGSVVACGLYYVLSIRSRARVVLDRTGA